MTICEHGHDIFVRYNEDMYEQCPICTKIEQLEEKARGGRGRVFDLELPLSCDVYRKEVEL